MLYWAADQGDLYKQNNPDFTPLHCAVRVNTTTSEILLNAKADPKIVDLAGYTTSHGIGQNNACSIKRIVELGVDINRINEHDATALHYACSNKRFEVVQERLAYGADINVPDKHGGNEVLPPFG